MVWPDMEVTMSPGLVAVLLGMFSQVGMTPTTLIGSSISAMACSVPSTLAAPHISYFISSMSAPGLSEMPPVSKVMPLPTSAIGFCVLAPPLYSSVISLGGCALPRVTDRKEPMPSFSMSFFSSTVVLIFLCALPNASALAAR